MEEPIVIRFRWTADELLRAHDDHSRHTSLPSIRIALHFIWALSIWIGYSLIRRGELVPLGVAMIVVGVYWFTLRRLERRWMIRRELRKRPDRDAEFEWQIAADKICARSNLGKAELSWQAFAKMVRTPSGVLLYTIDQIYHWLPRSAFASDAEFDRFIELAKTKIQKYYEVAGAAADWAHPLVAGLLAFPVCWFLALLFHVALLLYRGITFGFEDAAFHGDVALLIVTVFGSLAGVIAYLVAVPILLLRRRARPRAALPLSQKRHQTSP